MICIEKWVEILYSGEVDFYLLIEDIEDKRRSNVQKLKENANITHFTPVPIVDILPERIDLLTNFYE